MIRLVGTCTATATCCCRLSYLRVSGALCTGLLAVTASQWLIRVLRVLQFQARGRHDYAGGDQR